MINELSCEVAESPNVSWRAMALISLDFRRELSNWNIEHLSDLLTVFLEAESQVKVDQLQFDRHLGLRFLNFFL